MRCVFSIVVHCYSAAAAHVTTPAFIWVRVRVRVRVCDVSARVHACVRACVCI